MLETVHSVQLKIPIFSSVYIVILINFTIYILKLTAENEKPFSRKDVHLKEDDPTVLPL